jgi:hypothetical protein
MIYDPKRAERVQTLPVTTQKHRKSWHAFNMPAFLVIFKTDFQNEKMILKLAGVCNG